jgi:small subunit ribosomal protein S13
MARISGVDLLDNKRVEIALTYIYGIGRKNVNGILDKANIDKNKRVKELTEEEVGKIQKVIDKDYKVEGDLHTEILENIKRLKEIGSYRGLRHIKNLPVRGQRTRVNARTKRGKRQTVGALKKETRAKLTSAGVGKSEEQGGKK